MRFQSVRKMEPLLNVEPVIERIHTHIYDVITETQVPYDDDWAYCYNNNITMTTKNTVD